VTRFQHLAISAAAATYLLIVVGAVVRVTDSGLGCPDWPLCQGHLIPRLELNALIEYSHRLLGAVTSVLIMVTVAAALVTRRREPAVLVPAVLAPLLLALQIPLGAVVVLLELAPMAVLVHLAMAMLILALLVWLVVVGGAPTTRTGLARCRSRFQWLVWATVAAVLLLVLIGAYVRSSGGGWACPSFPSCNDGELLPLNGGPLVQIQLLHRGAASLVGVLVLVIAIEAWRTQRHIPPVIAATAALAIALVVQVGIGGATVLGGLPAALRGLHVAGAAGVWVSAVALASLSEWSGLALRPDPTRSAQQVRRRLRHA
jgi:heme A synthase